MCEVAQIRHYFEVGGVDDGSTAFSGSVFQLPLYRAREDITTHGTPFDGHLCCIYVV